MYLSLILVADGKNWLQRYDSHVKHALCHLNSLDTTHNGFLIQQKSVIPGAYTTKIPKNKVILTI